MKCVNTTGTAHCLIIVHYTNTVTYLQCQFHGLAISNAKLQIFFQIKYMEKNLPNSTRKLFWFEISEVLIAVSEEEFSCVVYYNFWHTFVP